MRINMTDDINIALDILDRAMKFEKEGNAYYLKAAKTTQDSRGKEMVTVLAQDEQKHYKLIKKQHISLTKKGRWTASSDTAPVKVDLNRNLFPIDKKILKETVTVKSDDKDALVFGMGIEMKSHGLYLQAAKNTTDALGKQMFEFLVWEEQSHFDTLMMRYDYLFGPVSWQY